MTDKRNGVPTLRAAAEAVVETRDCYDRAFLPSSLIVQIDHLRAALRTDRDLSARRTRRARGTDLHAPVTPTPLRGNRHE